MAHRRSFRALFCLLSAFLLPFFSSGQTPQLLNYQGRLLDGTNLVSGVVGLSLRLFDASTAGTLLYEDSNTVTVADGLYATLIGDDTVFGTLPAALESTNVWIEVAVNGTALTPRERLVSAAYAVAAREAEGVRANAITASMIATGSVQTVHLAAGAVTVQALAAGAVTTAALADGAVSGGKIASNAVTTAHVVDGALMARDLSTFGRLGRPLAIANPNWAFDLSSHGFGCSVSAVGTDRFVVGTLGATFGTFFPYSGGVANLYQADGYKLLTLTGGDSFGWAVAGVGADRFVVAACESGIGGANAGCAYVFNTSGTLLATVTNPLSPAANSQFGRAVAALGQDRFIVGAPYLYNGFFGYPRVGAACLYDLNGTLCAVIHNPSPSLEACFGWSVAGLGSDRIAVGAPSFVSAGTVYIHNTNGSLHTVITNPAVSSGTMRFGWSLAAVGSDRLVVGAPYGATEAGKVFLYSSTGTLLATISNPEPATGDHFGYSVSGVGTNRFVVGCVDDDMGATNAGRAYLYDANGTLLERLAHPTPGSDEQFGYAVAGIGLDRLVVSAINENSGTLRLYTPTLVVTGLISDGVAPNTIGVDQLNTTNVDARYVLKSGDTMSGPLTATAFTGGGSGLSNIGMASLAPSVQTNISARLSSNVWAVALTNLAVRSGSNTFVGAQAITGELTVGGTFQVSGTTTMSGTTAVLGTFLGSPPYIKLAETQAKGTDAGGNGATTSNFRDLNAELADTHGLATLTNGNVMLPAGTYQCRISAPAYRVDTHQIRLRIVNGATLLYGTSEFSDNALSPGVQTRSWVDGSFTLASNATLTVQHFTAVIKTVNGLGLAAGATWTDSAPYEVYTVAEFWKVK